MSKLSIIVDLGFIKIKLWHAVISQYTQKADFVISTFNPSTKICWKKCVIYVLFEYIYSSLMWYIKHGLRN